MAKYLYVYHGGSVPQSKQAQEEAMAAWGEWLGGMGSGLIDGGNPVGRSSTVHSDGTVTEDGGANPVSGYSLVEAATREEAIERAKGCPIRQAGGSVEVAEAMDM